MKIVLCCRVYPTQRPGGMPHVVQDRFKELVKQGHDVRVLTTGESLYPHLDEKDDWVVHLKCPTENYSREYAEQCDEYCRSFEPEIIHMDSFDNQHLWWEKYRSVAKIAITLHGFSWGAMLTQWNTYLHLQTAPPTFDAGKMAREIENLKKAHRVIAVSRHEHYMLEECYGLSNVSLVYNPIASYFYDKEPLDEPGEYYVCCAVSGQVLRGFNLAQRACNQLNVPLVVPNVRRKELPAIFDKAKALLLPTFYSQGYDLAVAEAFSRGVPVIASRVGSYINLPIVNFDMGDLPGLMEAMKNTERRRTSKMYLTAVEHRPGWHVKKWMEAILGGTHV